MGSAALEHLYGISGSILREGSESSQR